MQSMEILSKDELYALSDQEIMEKIAWPSASGAYAYANITEALEDHPGTRVEALEDIFTIIAKLLLNEALTTMMIQNGQTALASILYQPAIREAVRSIEGQPINTLAVTMRGDGVTRLYVNPEFFAQLATSNYGQAFGLTHEAYHLIFAHLYVNRYMRADPDWTLATEGIVNWWVQKHIKGLGAIVVQGVDPVELYNKYKLADKKLGNVPVKVEEFYETDEGCYAHIKRAQPKIKNFEACHLESEQPECSTCSGTGQVPNNEPLPQGGGDEGDDEDEGQDEKQGNGSDSEQDDGTGQDSQGSGSGSSQGEDEGQDGHGGGTKPCPDCGGSGNAPTHGFDPETLRDTVETGLRHAVHRAKEGETDLAEVLQDIEISIPSASQTWGDLGFGGLRGETDKGRAHPIWGALMKRAMASRLTDDRERLGYDRKTGWFPTAAKGMGRPLAPRVRGEKRYGLIAVDTSGSMPDVLVRRIAGMLGSIENVDSELIAFDGAAWPFTLGEPLQGGGGTSFEAITDYIENELDDDPDMIIVVTDGYAPHISPPNPEKWVWLITEGGSTWPKEQSPEMTTIEVDDMTQFNRR